MNSLNETTKQQIESNLLSLYREVSIISTILKEVSERLKEMEEKMDIVKSDLAHYRGIAGGILWLGAALWGAFAVVKEFWPR